MIKRKLVDIFCVMSLALMSVTSHAAGEHNLNVGELHLDPNDLASLQRGARNFINTCAGCHSLEFMRFSQMAEDIGITRDDGTIFDSLLQTDLMFTSDTITDPILSAIPEADALKWFGVAPPDLTLTARVHNPYWLYQYLLSFYIDEQRPWGVNNAIFPDVGMPHVLVELQGEQQPIYSVRQIVDLDGEPQDVREIIGFNLTKPGLLTPAEYDTFVTDLVNFLVYVGEPVKQKRERLGIWVLLFLILILAFSYVLKREYWKDIH